MKHYLNASRGLGHEYHVENASLCRIESTACEQGHWDKVIMGAGPDMLATLVSGQTVVFHDTSEKWRQTRAFWQGLSFVRFCLAVRTGLWETERRWMVYPRQEPLVRVPHPEGVNVFSHFWAAYKDLPNKTRNEIDYWGRRAERLGDAVYCGGVARAGG